MCIVFMCLTLEAELVQLGLHGDKHKSANFQFSIWFNYLFVIWELTHIGLKWRHQPGPISSSMCYRTFLMWIILTYKLFFFFFLILISWLELTILHIIFQWLDVEGNYSHGPNGKYIYIKFKKKNFPLLLFSHLNFN